MKLLVMNLASRPFLNEQPVIRTTALLWILGLALLAMNVTLYYRHIEGKGEQQESLRVADERLVEETATIERLRGELERLDLERQNEQVRFLNSQIAQRVFSWSVLFDRLAEVVPSAIQMKGISPRIVASGSTGRRGSSTEPLQEVVKVDLQGTSRDPEAALELVDALFAHPSFFDPDLSRESAAEGQENTFNLSVLYLPPRIGDGGSLSGPVGTEPAEAGEESLEVVDEGDPDAVTESTESMGGGE